MNILDEAEKRYPMHRLAGTHDGIGYGNFIDGARWAYDQAAQLAQRVAEVNGHMLFGKTSLTPDAIGEDIANRLNAIAHEEEK